MATKKRLTLGNGPFGGVCAGLANYFDCDPIIPRLIFLALVFGDGCGLGLYFIFWLAMPN
jgi:phage shock protein C